MMKLRKSLARISISNIFYYIQGTLRYKFYYGWFKFLIRTHILEQIDYRISVMDSECYDNGVCKMCGCSTTALQMCNKACDKPCYPRMMSSVVWKLFKLNHKIDINTIK